MKPYKPYETRTKNPYELRTDILAMAKDILDAQYAMHDGMRKHLKEQGALAEEAWAKYIPKMYTTEEIKKTARELYEFVEQSDKKE